MSHVIDPPPIEPRWDLWEPRHEVLRARVREWVDAHIRPFVDEWEAEDPPTFPRELFAHAAAAGLFGWKVDEAFAGNGVDFLADCVVVEELARSGSGGVAAALGAHKDLGAYYLWRFGTDEQRRRWVVPALRGEIVTALGVTEPHAGTDVASIRTRASRQPDGDWVLNGSKTFITNGSWADAIVVAAVTSEDGGHHGQTLFVVERDDEGFTSRRIPTLGWRTSHTGELSFADVRLPADRVLGGEELVDRGFHCIMRNFQWERVSMSLAATVASRRVLDDGTALLVERHSAIPPAWRPRLADLSAEVDAVRALTLRALRRYLHGDDAVREVSMAKWASSLLSVKVADEVLQLLGEHGVTGTPWVQRALRDARLNPIGGGTTEIMKEVVGRSYGL
jgi:alkylation response protein AidB-like acyl-CoA dehydrogenase